MLSVGHLSADDPGQLVGVDGLDVVGEQLELEQPFRVVVLSLLILKSHRWVSHYWGDQVFINEGHAVSYF